jgi:bifunctional DNase/RNase
MKYSLRLLLSFSIMAVLLPAPAALAADVRIQQVEVALSEAGPVILLKSGNRAIPVFVDPTVAESVHAALSGGKLRRPYPHNLMHSILIAYKGSVTQVSITLKEATYYAALTVQLGDVTQVFDSRASDAIALATLFKAPIMVSRELLDTQGRVIDVPGAQSL